MLQQIVLFATVAQVYKCIALHLFNAVTPKDLMRYPSGLSVISSSQCMSTNCVVSVLLQLLCWRSFQLYGLP